MNPDSAKHLTGGSAFPYIDPNLGGVCEGVSIRDYFAGKALEGFMSQSGPLDGSWEMDAKAAYEVADAMLAERVK